MTIEEALNFVDTALGDRPLSDLQEYVFCQAWQGHSYTEIADNKNHDPDYIKHVGCQLWRSLSDVLGQKVTKSNLHTVLRRHTALYAAVPDLDAPSVIALNGVAHLDSGNGHRRINISSKGCGKDSATHVLDNRHRIGPILSGDSTKHQAGNTKGNVSGLTGRTHELTLLREWLIQDHNRLITLLGIGGMGKTALATEVTQQLKGEFDCLIWRSLRNAPSFTDLLPQILSEHSDPQESNLPETTEDQIEHTMAYLQRHRCLLVLDGFEAILQSNQLGAHYRSGYEAYGKLLREVRNQPHQSCVLITSREQPNELIEQEGQPSTVRSLHLRGLSASDIQTLFTTLGLTVSSHEAEQLSQQYGGNPFALKAVATSIQSLFAHNVSTWIGHGTVIFGEIQQLLDQQLQRLSALERRMMFWLAMQREWVDVETIQDAMVIRGKLSYGSLLEILQSLQRRSLIETSSDGFNLQPYLRQYLQERLITQALVNSGNSDSSNSG